MAANRRCRLRNAWLWGGLALVLVVPAGVGAGPPEADVQLDYGVISDPGTPGALTYRIINAGPSDANHIVVRVPLPTPATLRDVVVYSPCRIGTPGNGQPGEVIIEIERLTTQEDFSFEVYTSLPNEPGPVGQVHAQVSADEVDPNPENNVLTIGLGVPPQPTIDRIRVLRNPFRLEITGTNLRFRPFGSVVLGCGVPYYAAVESEDPTGTRVVVGRGKELMRQVPIGYTATITLYTIDGARLETSYTRQP